MVQVQGLGTKCLVVHIRYAVELQEFVLILMCLGSAWL